MTRLDLELQRLYRPPAPGPDAAAPLLGAGGHLRALVLEVHGPADWPALARVWQGVQAELAWPAPAIAVNGDDGFQLWFSLAAPVPAAQAAALLEALRQRHLPDMPARRVRLLPGTPGWHPGAVPARRADHTGDEQWSAFISQDLAPMFADTPWLDTPPNPDGQAGLLATLRCIPVALWQQALETLGLQPAPGGPAAAAPIGAEAGALPPATGFSAAGTEADPRRFLLAVMNDPAVPLALRIDAAKALLPGAGQR